MSAPPRSSLPGSGAEGSSSGASQADGSRRIRGIDHSTSLSDLELSSGTQSTGRATYGLHQLAPGLRGLGTGDLRGAAGRAAGAPGQQVENGTLELTVEITDAASPAGSAAVEDLIPAVPPCAAPAEAPAAGRAELGAPRAADRPLRSGSPPGAAQGVTSSGCSSGDRRSPAASRSLTQSKTRRSTAPRFSRRRAELANARLILGLPSRRSRWRSRNCQ